MLHVGGKLPDVTGDGLAETILQYLFYLILKLGIPAQSLVIASSIQEQHPE